MKRYRLLTQAYIDGAVRERGYEFSLPDDVRPPYRNRHAGHVEMIEGARANILPDEPLAVEVGAEVVVPDEPEPADATYVDPALLKGQ